MSGAFTGLTAWRPTALLCAVVAVGVALFHSVYIVPAQSRVGLLRHQLHLRRTESPSRYTAARESGVPPEVEWLRQRLAELYAGIPDRRDVSALLDDVQSLSTRSGLRLLSFSPEPATGEESRSWVATVRLDGTYDALLTFVARLGEGPGVHTVKKLAIEAHDRANAAATIAIECQVSVVLRPPGQPDLGDVDVSSSAALAHAIDVDAMERDPFVRAQQRPVAVAPPHVELRPEGLAGLAVAELTLRGTLETPHGRVAFLAESDGRTHTVRSGDELLDGIVGPISHHTLVIVPKGGGAGVSPAATRPLTMVRAGEVR